MPAKQSDERIDSAAADLAQERPGGFPWWTVPLALSWGFGAWLYTRLPQQVPVHWGLDGQVDRYGGPAEAAFLLPGIMLFMAALLLLILPRYIPSTPDYAGTRRVYTQLIGGVLCFMLYVQVVTSMLFMGQTVPLIELLCIGAGLMFIFMGNLLPKLKRNPIAGARLPWAMRDDLVWLRTQRAAGLAFVLLGLPLVCAAPLPSYLPLVVLLAGKALIVAAVVWYSYRISRQGVQQG